MTCAELTDRLRHLGAPPHVIAEAAALAPTAPDGAALAAALVARGLVRPDVAQAALTPAGPTLRRGASERQPAVTTTVDDRRTLARGAAAGRPQVASSSGERTLPRGSERLQPVAPTAATTTSTTAPAPATTSFGLTGRYELTDAIGSGGEAVVYAAKDLTLGREVAIKLVRPDHAHDPTTARDLLAEAQATGRLEHPGVVPVHEVGTDPQRGAFLAMKLVRGRTFTHEIEAAHARVRQGEASQPNEERRLLEAALKVCDTLAYVHSRGVLHRDLKAENVMVGEFGEVHVMDFGLARAQDATATSSAGELQGTPRCMAPEQAAGRADLDERVDVYAVGALLFHVIAGATPFARIPDLGAVLAAVRAGRAGRPSRAPDAWRVAPALEAIVLRAMARARESRYAKVTDLAADLRAYLAGERVSAHREGVAERLVREARRRPRLVVGSTVAVVCLGLGGLALVRAQGQAALREATARQEAADGARSTLADAARAEAQAALTQLAAGGDDTGARTGQALAAVQAAQRWHDLTTGAARQEAARALFDAANALGEVALATSQWDLAERAFALERGLDVDEPRAEADVARAGQARTAEARRRRAEIEGWLAQAASGELAERPDGLTDAVFAIVHYPEAQTVELLVERLDAVSAQLREIEARVWLEAEDPDTDEARAGAKRLVGLADSVRALQCLRPGDPVPEAIPLALKPAAERLEHRAVRGRTDDQRRLITVGALIAGRQRQALGQGAFDLARVASEALGRLGSAELAVEALGRYVAADCEQIRAIPAGLSLCRLGGERALQLVHWARWHFGINSEFATQVGRALAAVQEAPELEGQSAQALWKRGEGRAAQGDLEGAIEDYDRALALDPLLGAGLYTNRGNARLGLGQLQAALADLDRAVEIAPDDARAYVNRGVVRHQLQDLEGARSDYDRAIELDPKLPDALINRGAVRQGLEDPQGAVADYDKAIDLDPTQTSAFMNRGVARAHLGDAAGAVADYDHALELDPRLTTALENRGVMKKKLGDLQGALLDFDQVLELEPRNVNVLLRRGDTKQELGDPRGAIEDFDRALAREPAFVAVYASRGRVRQHLGDQRGAITDFDRVLELDPNHVGARTNRGLARHALGDLTGAVADFDRSLELQPNRALVHVNRGTVRQAQGDLRRAVADYDRAIELDPGFVAAYLNRGLARQAQGDSRGAVTDYDHAIELDPRSSDAHLNRGTVRHAQGDLRRAVADYDRAIELDPHATTPLINRGLVRATEGDLRAAVADYDRALELDPRLPEALANRGAARQALGDLHGAIADYDRVIELAPDDPRAWNNRGLTRLKLGDPGAVGDFARFLELAPDHPQAPEVRRLIDQLQRGGR